MGAEERHDMAEETAVLKRNEDIAPHAAAAMTLEQYAKRAGEQTVTMIFPRRVLLTLQDYRRVEIQPGTREVPESIAGHWYLRDMGAERYAAPAPPNPPEAVPEKPKNGGKRNAAGEGKK